MADWLELEPRGLTLCELAKVPGMVNDLPHWYKRPPPADESWRHLLGGLARWLWDAVRGRAGG